MRLASIILGLWLCAPSATYAQAVVTLTVEEAVERALEHNLRLRAAAAETAEAEAAFRQARGARWPTVHARGSYTRLSQVPEVEFEFPGVDTTFTLFPVPLNQVHSELSTEVPLFAGFRITNQIRAARSGLDAAALMAEAEAADVAFDVRTAYWHLQQALLVREAIEVAVAAVDAHLLNVERLVEEGAALRIDLLRAQTRRSEVQLERLQAENDVQVARLELNRLIGLPLNTPVQITGALEELPYQNLDDLLTLAAETQPGLAAMARQVEGLQASVAVARGAWLPEVSGFGRVIYARPNPLYFIEQDEFRGHWELGLTARWTLFDAGRPGSTDQARARMRAAEARLADAREVLGVAVAQRYLEVQRAAEAARVAAQHVAEAEEAFRVVERQFEEGAALAADVLDAEQVLRAAQAGQARAIAGREIARAALLTTVGRVR